MVCDKCKEKLKPLNHTAPWKEGATNRNPSSGGTKAKNKLIEHRRTRKLKGEPFRAFCRICKQTVTHEGHRFCQECSYKNGICSRCGIKVLDTKVYKMRTR
eukprot:TRINITY_DN5451_c0_g1_i1.p1 TRINITY_DN5451_c0_g1~~TRINITY_DN5451_c0_g1_i1.p1  ORF type:complete len:108 (+),score=7.76 TRINITY_DN5451_c0_g1_i1:23-325(+)